MSDTISVIIERDGDLRSPSCSSHPADEVHVWTTPLPVDVPATELASCLQLLEETELTRYQRFVLKPTKLQFALSHAFLRLVLSRYAQVEPSRWRYLLGPHGKPSIDPAIGPPLEFNFSHTTGYAACAVGFRWPVGVDVEWIDGRVDTALVSQSFAAEEQADLRMTTGDAQRLQFYRLWTAKEAVIKCRGTGLHTPLDGFAIRFDPADQPYIERSPWESAAFRTRLINLPLPTANYALAVALQLPNQAHPTVRLYQQTQFRFPESSAI